MGCRRLTYPCRLYLETFMIRIQGMTELVNGTFIGDLSTLLSSCAEGKNIFFEIDKEFESMMVIVKSNFVRVDSFLLSMWVSLPLRQSLIHKLVDVKSTDSSRTDKDRRASRGPYCWLVKR